MGPVRMIISDLDKTLLGNDKRLSPYTMSVLWQCHQLGIRIVYATARPERCTWHLWPEGPVDYVIANNGATIAAHGKRIRNIAISVETQNALIQRLLSHGGVLGMTLETGDFLYTNDPNHARWSLDAAWNARYTDLSQPFSEPISKISVECETPDFLPEIVGEYPELRLLVNHCEKWHQITHRDTSKFLGVQRVASLLDVGMEEIAAFGDDYNDVEMLRGCGMGVAVANAVADAKEAARYLCLSNEEDGVAKFLQEAVLAPK